MHLEVWKENANMKGTKHSEMSKGQTEWRKLGKLGAPRNTLHWGGETRGKGNAQERAEFTTQHTITVKWMSVAWIE